MSSDLTLLYLDSLRAIILATFCDTYSPGFSYSASHPAPPLRPSEVLAPLDSTFHSLPRGAANCDDDMSQLRATAIQTHRQPSSNAGDWLATGR
jgi:hypothetical protein